MSMRIAVALAATIGAGALMSTAATASPDVVGFHGDYAPGTIVVKTNERRLYLVLDSGMAVRYPVGVGKAGKQWAGTTRIDGKYRNPAWSPPAEVKHDKPSMPDVIPGGSPHNPMGVAAMTLAGGEYAIHGTNMPGLLWLHPDVEQRHYRSLSAGLGRHHRGGLALGFPAQKSEAMPLFSQSP
jgi:lipoprotein-anchoring transpeptidase ErfK/SrfK